MKKRKIKQNISLQVIIIGLLLLGVLVVNAVLEKVTIVEYPPVTEKNDKQQQNSNSTRP